MAERGSVRHNMTNHRPTDADIAVIEQLREVAIGLGEHIERVCEVSRERSLAITNLEQALMWAVASIARSTPPDD